MDKNQNQNQNNIMNDVQYDKSLDEIIGEFFMKNKLIAGIIIIFFITVGLQHLYNASKIATLKETTLTQSGQLVDAQIKEDYLKAPRIYLETVTEARAEMVRYEEATINEIESLKAELERIRTDKYVAEMQIRCAREAMYNIDLDCNVDFENYSVK